MPDPGIANVTAPARQCDNGVMCGRFVQASEPETYADVFHVDRIVAAPLPASYNVAPTDPVYAVAQHDGERLLGAFRWGLIPFWAKDRRIAARNINARAETVAEKSSFRDSFASRRCIIPADGFYEWQVKPKGKLPHFIHGAQGSPLALAGLWASWKDPESGERVRTCTIVTGAPNTRIAELHDRMPVILPESAWATWLSEGEADRGELEALLVAAPDDALAHHPVSTLVNKVANNVPECIAPLETPAVDQ
jgi:putative SOS response-associated peptidase YedK